MQQMNGKAVSNKRLKVQLKKGDEKLHMSGSSMMMDSSINMNMNMNMYSNMSNPLVNSDLINNVSNS